MPFQVRLTLRRGIPAPPDLAPPDVYDVITANTPYFSIDRVSGVFPHARLTLLHTTIDSKRRFMTLLSPIKGDFQQIDRYITIRQRVQNTTSRHTTIGR